MPEYKKEQEEVINFNDGNILVSASAGSGKTFTYQERAVRLIVEKKASVNEILAVTFTEAAAREMKEKLKKALTEKYEENFDPYIKEQIEEIDYADISTIHSFLSRIIRKYYFAVNLSPDYKIIDEVVENELKYESLDNVLQTFYENKEAWFYRLVKIFSFARNDDALKDMILNIYSFCEVEANPKEVALSLPDIYCKENLDKVLASYFESLKENYIRILELAEEKKFLANDIDYEKGKGLTFDLVDYLEKVLKTNSVYEIKKISFPYFDLRGGNVKDEKKDVLNGVKTCINELERINKILDKSIHSYEFDLANLDVLRKDVSNLVRLVLAFKEEYGRIKLDENGLDFADLEHFAYEILQNEDILKEVKNKYKYIFVDEYQDVNGVQESILSLLRNNNMYMVGDVKQSIYGFRGCKPEIFMQKEREMKKNGEKTAQINYNFRCAKNIIDMVNEIFEFSMTEKVYGLDYNTQKLILGGVYPEDKVGRAQFHFISKQKEKDSTKTKDKLQIYDIVNDVEKEETEEDLVAGTLAKLIFEELGKTYYDFKAKDENEKPISFKDIAILCRRREGSFVAGIVNGLKKRGIPVESDCSENVCEFSEVYGLIAILKLIVGSKDEIALVNTMLGVLGNFSEQDLVDIKISSKEKSFYNAVKNYNGDNEVLKEKLNKFFNLMDSLRFFADFNSAHDVLTKILADTGYEYYYLAKTDGNRRLNRIKRFISVSKGEKECSVKEFLYKIDKNPKAFMLENNCDDDSVLVSTIHSSKGLEYPVVFVCGLENTFKIDNEGRMALLKRDFGLAIKYYDEEKRLAYSTPFRGYILEQEFRQQIKEELRLLYVALTRAKYSLHLLYCAKSDDRKDRFISASSFLDYIPKKLDKNEINRDELTFINAKDVASQRVYIVEPNKAREEKLKSYYGFNYEYKDDLTVPLKSSATKLNKHDDEEVLEKTDFNYVIGNTSSEKGTIAHKIAENIDFLKGDFIGQVNAMIEKGTVTGKDVDKVDLKRIFSAIEKAGLNKLTGDIYKEKSFIFNAKACDILPTSSTESVVIQGAMDLLVIENGKARIFDYKYSKKTGEKLKATYKNQLNVYALAVETVLKVKVIEKTLINIYTGDIETL